MTRLRLSASAFTHSASVLALTLLLTAPALANGPGTLTQDAPLRAGAGDGFGQIALLPAGTRVTVTASSGGWARLDLQPVVSSWFVQTDADGRAGRTRYATRVRGADGAELGRLPSGVRVAVMGRSGWWRLELAAYVPASSVRLDAATPPANGDRWEGAWTTRGRHSARGEYEGTVEVRRGTGGPHYLLTGSCRFADGSTLVWSGSGRRSGSSLRVDATYDTGGAAGVIGGSHGRRGRGRYTAHGDAVTGGWRDRDDTALSISERWTRGGDGGTPPTTQTRGTLELPAKLLAVPGTPAAGHKTLQVTVQGAQATLRLSGPGRLLKDGQAVLDAAGSLELDPGQHTFAAEGTGDGTLALSLTAGGAELASARAEVTVERLYLILFGYQGAEVDYLPGDLKKTVDNIVPHLGAKYSRIQDGASYDQAKIDAAIDDADSPRKVVIDWCTTRDDLLRYFRRGTVRGATWGSHGYMEPWTGCTDEELDIFESRVWTSAAGRPEDTEFKTFTREWREALARSVETHGKLDFLLMHSCCTGGIGSYRDELWNYTDAGTKARARQVLGDPLPTHDEVRYKSFSTLEDQADHVKTYDGPSYFGMWDVNWTHIRRSLQPTR